MYRIGTELDVKRYNFLLHQGGLGDAIAQLPAIKYVLDNHKQIFINLWTHDYFVPIANSVFKKYNNIKVYSVSDHEKYYVNELPARSPYIHGISNLSCHLTEHAFLSLVGKSVEPKDMNYLNLDPVDISKFNLSNDYVVITTGFTSNTRIWKADSVKKVAEYCVSKGYTPVYLGKSFTQSYKDDGIKGNFIGDYSNGINLIDQTNLFEAYTIMSNSKVVLGLDNGLIHLAAMTNVPIITGFTTVEPEHRLPYRQDVKGFLCETVMPSKEELKCIGCQSNMNFTDSSHSFTKCFYDDYKCLDLMTSDKWIEKLRKYV